MCRNCYLLAARRNSDNASGLSMSDPTTVIIRRVTSVWRLFLFVEPLENAYFFYLRVSYPILCTNNHEYFHKVSSYRVVTLWLLKTLHDLATLTYDLKTFDPGNSVFIKCPAVNLSINFEIFTPVKRSSISWSWRICSWRDPPKMSLPFFKVTEGHWKWHRVTDRWATDDSLLVNYNNHDSKITRDNSCTDHAKG